MERWSVERANAWYENIPWQVGFNFLPSTAVNSIEMWQKETFDEATIRKELAMAAACGYNSLRVFLPYNVWAKEREAFLETFETFLQIAAENCLSVMPILFDDCAFDHGQDPFYGPQLPPVPGVHNSRWTPSPGFKTADDPAKQPLLREYLQAVIDAHKEDSRILAWDLYNEPGNTGRSNEVLPLLVNSFRWARECQPSQPLTSGVWNTENAEAINSTLLDLCDVLSFHSYLPLENTAAKYVDKLETQGRPIFVTEWLCRQHRNTFANHLPYWKSKKISCWHWGLVVGKTQTDLWWEKRETEPSVWQHDVLYPDGTAYDEAEMQLLLKLRK